MRALAVVIATLLFNAGASAQMRPHSKWQQIESEHFRVIFEAGLDSLAQHAARRAEAAYERLRADLTRPPRRKIDIMLGDNFDLTNGAATPFPNNRIYLWARPPVDDLALGYYNDWMDLVIAHELTHIFHMDRAGLIGRALRTVFGRAPFPWPLFPVIGTPDWTLEGLATYRESAHTGVGRVPGSYHDMILRTAVLEDDFDPIDRVNSDTPIWPGGQRAYIYGSMFMDYLAERFGEDGHGEFVDRTAGSWLPPTFVMNGIGRRTFGKSLTTLYNDWRAQLRERYNAQADSIRAARVTETERISGGERWTLYPRVSPDGRKLAFLQEDGRNTTSIVVLDLQSGAPERTRRNSQAPHAWADNQTLFTTQPELIDPYTIYSDIYTQTRGDQQRVTRGARYDAIDVDRSGRKLIVVANEKGLTSLVQRDAGTGAERVIVPGRSDVQWTLPRWSPDGSRIAVQRWTLGGNHDVVVLDTLGNLFERGNAWVLPEHALDAAPAWSPDGQFVLFTSDRSGVNNIYAFDPAQTNGLVFQVTNLLTGAFYPDVSPDRQWIYFSGYHSDGFAIERIRFDTASWRPVAYSAQRDSAVVPPQTGPALEVRDYSALRSALPKFWLPLFAGDSLQGTFVGFFTLGFDDVNRHAYELALGYNFSNGRTQGLLDYTYAGLGNPLLNFTASREYQTIGDEFISREDNLALRARLLRPRWRSNAAFTLGVEATRIQIEGLQSLRSTETELLGVTAGGSFGNYRVPAYAISAEDGMRAGVFARRRFELDPGRFDASYTELNAVTAGYKSISAFGFAHHVLAARAHATLRSGLGIGPTDVGGVDNFLPVRGFEEGDRFGYRAWSASLEYRLPLALIGRGIRMLPIFVDRTAFSAFVDAGNAACTTEQRETFSVCPGNEGRSDEMLLSAGAEIGGNVALLSFIPSWWRAGVAKPLQGPRNDVRFYLTFGQSF